MNKVKLEFKLPKNKTIEHNGTEIEVMPFMRIAEQIVLINRYLFEYFGENKEKVIESVRYNYLEAEFNLKNYIFQSNTNIDYESLENDIYMDCELWEKITSEILNYKEFRKNLDHVVSEVKEQIALDNSLGVVLERLVEKGYGVLEKFSEITPEEIEKLQKSGVELSKQLEESSILKDMARGGKETK